MPIFSLDLDLDANGMIAAAAKRRVEQWIDDEVARRTQAVEHDLMLVVGMLAARHPDGVTFTIDEYDRARKGRLVRLPSDDPRQVTFHFLPT